MVKIMKKILVFSVILFLLTSAFSVAGAGTYDFEDGKQGWTGTGFWHWVTPSNSNYPNSHSGIGSFWYGLEGNGSFDNGLPNSGMLISPLLSNPTTLTFWTRWEIESADPNYYDLMQITANDGEQYVFLQLNPTEDPSDYSGYYSSAGYNVPGTWVKHTVDLRQYPGTTRVVFYFDTVDASYNHPSGWYIDDVQIFSNSLPIDKFLKILQKNRCKNHPDLEGCNVIN